MTLRVWAPDSSTVEALLGPHGELRLPMERETGGWWALEIPPEAPRSDGEVDYAFSLDGGEALADPRSAWQPAGVAGPSRTFDVARHAWQDSGWAGPRDGRGIPGGVIYELHVGTFTPEGTLDAAIGRLDHLVALGIGWVELLPVNTFAGLHNWGYDGVLWYTVQEDYGGPEAYRRFVDAAHDLQNCPLYIDDTPALRALLQGNGEAARRMASPVHRMHAAAPPFFLFHGTRDAEVPIAQAEAMAETLTEQGVRVEFYRMELRGHTTTYLTVTGALQAAAQFLWRTVAEPETDAQTDGGP